MSRQASFHIDVSQHHQDGQNLCFSLTSSGRLSLLFVIALFLTLLLATGNVTAEMLFQSPQSPPAQPPAEQPPAEQPPAEQPPAEQPPAEQPSAEQPVTEPVTPLTPAPAGEAPLPGEPLPDEAAETASDETSDEYPFEDAQEEPNLTLDQAELIDSIVVSGAQVWRCCGFILFLFIPLFFLILYIRGRGKITQEEGF